MIKVGERQMRAVFAMHAGQRFEHFVKVVADCETLWGLYNDGWALAATDDGAPILPLWPAPEYARACAINEWRGYAPRSIALNEFMRSMLPVMKDDGVSPSVLMTPAGKGAVVSVDELLSALQAELRNY